MWIANFFGGGLTLILGVVYRIFDAYDGLSGFSTMNEEEKSKWDIIGAGRFITQLMIISGAILVIGGILTLINFMPNLVMAVSWILFSIIIITGAIYINVSKRFKRRK